MHKQKSAKYIGSMVILTSLAVLAALTSGRLTSVVTTSSLKPLVFVYGQEAVQLLPNNSSNTNTTTIQIPQTAKGPTIPTAIKINA
jgi:hypothetical protein